MPSTITLARTLGVTQQFVRNAPLTFASPANNDPGFTNADWVRQFILSPPFAWRWNRATASTTLAIGQTDYVLSLGGNPLGWIEKATVTDPTDGNKNYELEISVNLAKDSQPNLPTHICAQNEDASGNISVRISPAPDQAYPLVVTYQIAPLTFSAATQTWSPIPDYLSYLYTQGMRSQAYEYISDERYSIAYQIFLTQVLDANNGLTDTQKAIFLADRLNIQRDVMGLPNTERK